MKKKVNSPDVMKGAYILYSLSKDSIKEEKGKDSKQNSKIVKKTSSFLYQDCSPDEKKALHGLLALKGSEDSTIREEEVKETEETLARKILKGKMIMTQDSSSDECEEDSSSDENNAYLVYSAVAIKKPKLKADVIKKPKAMIKKVRKKGKIVEEDDTEETIQLLLQQINNQNPPSDTIVSKIRNAVTVEFSRCVHKQLTESDVKGSQSRLMLGKKEVKDKFVHLLEDSEISGVDVLVYGSDGKSHEMKFKMWNKDTPVLMNGWSNFVKAYGLQKYSDVLKIWMFRSSEDRKICFVIDSIRFDDITKQLSKRILKKVFQN